MTRTPKVIVGEILDAPSGGLVSVRVNEADVDLHVMRGYSPTVGDQALVVVRGSSGYVVGSLGTAPPDPDPEPADTEPPPDPIRGSTLLRPVSTGTYRGGWRVDTTDLFQGDATGRGLNQGAAFYGIGPRGLRGVTVTGVRIHAQRITGGTTTPETPTFQLIEETVRAGAPTFLDDSPGVAMRPGETHVIELPTSWGTDMLAGDAGGIGIYVPTESPYIGISGATMQLQIDWER